MKKAQLLEFIISAADQCLTGCDSGNPLEAWAHFIDKLDAMGRSHIGDSLERSGRDRYTGRKVA